MSLSLYEQMIAAAMSFDRRPAPEEPPARRPATPRRADDGERPGDVYNRLADWRDVLEPHGWVLIYERSGELYWKRPGKTAPGISATTCLRPDCGKDLLYVFTTSGGALDPERSYDKFGAFAVLNYSGDHSAASKALVEAGWGAPSVPLGKRVLAGPPNGNGQHSEPDRGKIIRIPASQLRRLSAAEKWFWKGIIPAEMVTILSALPKAGKTTLLAHLLRGAEAGGPFCGQELKPARVVYVTEESETLWAERRDSLGLKDHCEFVLRPFRSKPTLAEWLAFVRALTESLRERPAELVVIDTLAKLWPVQNENDASEVTGVLTPLLEVAYSLHAALVLIHHLRKTEGLESTATRGSGGITASVDCILELRRYKPGDRQDRRRVLHCDSRFDDKLDECVIQLGDGGYAACGDRRDTARDDAARVILGVLVESEEAQQAPGMTVQQIVTAGWEEGPAPTKRTLLDAFRHGSETGMWRREGTGQKGSPYTYWNP